MKDYLSFIDHPTLLLWGERDLVFPPSVGKSLHQAIKGSKFHLIQRSGHMPMWETPDEVNQAILDFLQAESIEQRA
jgi:pimeloyl-ACP methyl ester carboxylesterase